jgi:hypothetical protein
MPDDISAGGQGAPDDAQVEAFLAEHLKEYHLEIGRIASVWAMLEFRMDQLIWHLINIEQTLGACLTTQFNGTAPRLRAIKSIIEFRGSIPGLITKLNKFTGDIIEPQEARNRAVHDPWFVAKESKIATQLRKATIKNKIVYESVPVDLAELKAVYDDSKNILVRFNGLRDEIIAEPLSALHERQRRRLYRAPLL